MAKSSGKKKVAKKKSGPKKSMMKKKTAPKKKTAKKKVVEKKKVAKKVVKKAAKKIAPKEKKNLKKKLSMPKPSMSKEEQPERMELAPEKASHPDAAKNIATEDPMRTVDQKAFNKFTAKADPHQHLYLSPKPKGSVKPSGKKPLWNK